MHLQYSCQLLIEYIDWAQLVSCIMVLLSGWPKLLVGGPSSLGQGQIMFKALMMRRKWLTIEFQSLMRLIVNIMLVIYQFWQILMLLLGRYCPERPLPSAQFRLWNPICGLQKSRYLLFVIQSQLVRLSFWCLVSGASIVINSPPRVETCSRGLKKWLPLNCFRNALWSLRPNDI